MTMFDARDSNPGAWLLDKIDAREQALTCQIEQIQAEIDALTARVWANSGRPPNIYGSPARRCSPSRLTPPMTPNRPRNPRHCPAIRSTSRFSPSSPTVTVP
ncbi:hypothetical protein AB0C27_28330 [Nonomuraea sp. NPDC048882]|uniref:hypothetical protein n=1 Tax=Nonomuraea sp. NPDC048882 TaxID=3154347 RepID=UPI0033CD04BD